MRRMPDEIDDVQVAPLTFVLPDKRGLVMIASNVLSHLDRSRQHRCFSREAGGQLFAKFESSGVAHIVDITGPRPTDRRSLFNYIPDRSAEQIEITERFARGLHFIGDWHTHRQRVPEPSTADMRSIREVVNMSSHDLAGFLLLIVGLRPFPEGLHVSFHTRDASSLLKAEMSPQ
jgi:integrative and conjugative element protein (TIGR02256 family)